MKAKFTLPEAKKLYVRAKKAYYNTDKAIMTDAEFDRLEERIAELDPEWPELHKTGVLGKKSDVTFEYLMPSLAKIKADDKDRLGKWMLQYAPAGGVVSAKLDGSSIQAVYEKGKLVELATRGDGITGKSIMHLVSQLSIPKQVDSKLAKLVIRQEAVIPRKVFQARWAKEFETDRAAVSGLLNRQDGHRAHKDIQFVSLRILNSEAPLQEQLETLERLGLETPSWHVWRPYHLDSFVKLIEKHRKDYKYTTDGLVISGKYLGLPTDKRPKDVIAFKLNDEEGHSTVVRDIVWNASAFGMLVPKAVVDPVKIEGVTVKQASLHNARWLLDMGAGIGAEVRIIRSGDIIPKIIAVDKKAKVTLPKGVWDENKVHLMSKEGENKGARFVRMFKLLGIEHAGPSIAEECVKVFGTPDVFMTRLATHYATKNGQLVEFFSRVASEGVARRIVAGFDITKVKLANMIVATGFFGAGVGTSNLNKVSRLYYGITGCIKANDAGLFSVSPASAGPVFASKVAEGWEDFIVWLMTKQNILWLNKPAAKTPVTGGKLKGLCVSWTGYRSKEEEAWVEANGGQVVPFGSKTQALLHKEGGKASTKVSKAEAKGISVYTFVELQRSKAPSSK